MTARRTTRQKSPGKSPVRQALRGVAADPALRGRGPRPGAPNAGRPPDEFKAMCAGMASREATRRAVDRILGNENHPHFMAALRWATDRGYGKPDQTLDVTASVEHRAPDPPMVWKVGDRFISWN